MTHVEHACECSIDILQEMGPRLTHALLFFDVPRMVGVTESDPSAEVAATTGMKSEWEMS